MGLNVIAQNIVDFNPPEAGKVAGSLEHGYLFFDDEREYAVMQAKPA